MRACYFVMLPVTMLIACNAPITGPSVPAGIELVSGGGQQGVAGFPLPQPVVVRVVDDRGNPMRDIELRVATTAPLAKASSDSWTTDAEGQVSFVWRMGASVDGETVTVSAPGVSVVDPLTIAAQGGSRAVRAISGGLELYCAVTLDERLGCWQALTGSPWPVAPEQVPTITFRPESERYLDVALGFPSYGLPQPAVFGCAVRASGGVACFEEREGVESLTDIGGAHPPFERVFANHAFNSQFFCSLTADGEAWCWGKNSGGQLGNGTTDASAQPTRVVTEVRFTQLALGDTHACGLDATGTAWCWGTSFAGAMGTGSFGGPLLAPTAVLTPTRFVTLGAVGGFATCGREAVGTWWCWGHSLYGTLGNNSAVPQAANIPAGTRLAAADGVGLVSDPAGNASWWGDLYPTLDLHIARESRAVRIPFSVTRFSPAVHDKAACVASDPDGNRWLCVDLLWLAHSEGAAWPAAHPLVHGVP